MDFWAVGPDHVRYGQLEVLEWSAVLRDCDEGTWTMTLVDDDLSRSVVEGWRVIASEDSQTIFSGTVLSYGGDVGDESLTISGIDDTGLLGFRVTYPDPTKPAEQQSDAAYWKRSGPAGTLLDDLIYRNIANGAIAARRFPFVYVDRGSTSGGIGKGSSVSINSRYKNVLEEARALARAGGVTFWADQPDGTTNIFFRFRVPEDLTSWAWFSRGDGGGLTGGTYTLTAPTVTNVLVAGQGQGTDRTIKEYWVAPGPWGLRIEQFQDRRDTDDPAELEQAGTDTIAEGAASASATVEVEEVPGLVYGVDYRLGDIVRVDFGGAVIDEPVRAVELNGDPFGRTVKLTLGDHAAEDDNNPVWDKQIRALARRLRGLEAI